MSKNMLWICCRISKACFPTTRKYTNKQMGSLEGAKILKNNMVGVTLAGKTIGLAPQLALKQTKFIIKNVIEKGFSY